MCFQTLYKFLLMSPFEIHPHIEQIAAPAIYTEPICVPAVIKLLFLVSLKMVSLLSYHNL